MAKKKISKYQQRILVKPSAEKKVQTVYRKIRSIKKMEKNGIDTLEITTENGTRLSISRRDEKFQDNYENWCILWNYLCLGDIIDLEQVPGKVIRSKINISNDCYKVKDIQKFDDEVILTLKNNEKETEVKIFRTDNIICKEFGKEVCIFAYSSEDVIQKDVKLINIAGRNAVLNFF